jgi:hypothetical protein
MEVRMSATRTVSVTAAVERAASWTKTILIDRFAFSKWFILGFCAFLANLGRGGGSGSFNPNAFRKWDDLDKIREIGEWVAAHLTLILTIGGGLFVVFFALGVLLLWLASRGEFMFLDGVVKDRAAVEEPWFRFKRLGNSLFFFRLVLGLATFALFVLTMVLCWSVARPSLSGWRFEGNPWMALALGALVILPVSLATMVVNLFLRDFVVPIMYQRDLVTLEAFKVFASQVLGGRLGQIILFYLLKLALFIAATVIIFLGTCVTCCIAGLPYISSVVFLPLFVFFRCYSLYFLEQVDDGWRFFEMPAPPAPTVSPVGPSEPAAGDDVPPPPPASPNANEIPPEPLPPPHAEDV